MDNLIYNLIGYKTNNLLENSAIIIQQAYKNHKSYEINRRIDMIRRRDNRGERDNMLNEEKNIEEELAYWEYSREKAKCYSRSLKSLGWVYY